MELTGPLPTSKKVPPIVHGSRRSWRTATARKSTSGGRGPFWFAKLAKRRLRRGFPSVITLQEAIKQFVAPHNRDPKPFVWKPDPKTDWAKPREMSRICLDT